MLLDARCMISSHFAQNPGKGGKPMSAKRKEPNMISLMEAEFNIFQSLSLSPFTIPASQNNPALAKK